MSLPPLFTRAILRTPCREMVHGLTTANLGTPDYALALKQHAAYAQALSLLGLELTVLPPDSKHPDSCFVEDVALCTPHGAVVTRPGAESRRNEIAGIREVLIQTGYDGRIAEITAPGTLEAGDIMMVGGNYLVGASNRSNRAGFDQLDKILRGWGLSSEFVEMEGALHLKTIATYLEHGNLLVAETHAHLPEFKGFRHILVPQAEGFAANAIYVNGKVVTASGHPRTQSALQAAGYETIALDMSEFQKLDGGLSCLSLRF